MLSGSLFSGYSGLDLAVAEVFGATPAWFVEFDANPSKILAHHYPDVPNYGDVAAVDWSAVEPVDILTGGFPCQDLSTAGKRAGLRPGTRSGLWQHMAYAIDQLRPKLVVIENVRGLLSAAAHSDVEPCPWCVGDDPDGVLRALGAVLGDLAGLGYDARWCGVRAADAGAPHGRFRVFVVAYPGGGQLPRGPEPLTLLPTPRATDGTKGGPNQRGSRGDLMLPSAAVQLLPTPTSRDHKGRNQRNEPDCLPVAVIDFGPYAAAVARWEATLGRPAPAPIEPGTNGQPRLSPAFVEWMMGLPAGWVTATGISRNAQLKALGNGVVPQQAALALRLLGVE